jgi:hypothetical protein
VIPQTVDVIHGAAALNDEQRDALTARFWDAAVEECITDAQGVSLLEASGLPSLLEGDDPALLVDALFAVLDALAAGTVDPAGANAALTVWAANDGSLEELAGLLDEQLSPPGILNAIGGALTSGGYPQTDSATVFAQVEFLIETGVPPGIVLCVAKQAIRDSAEPEMEHLLGQLQLLGDLIAEGLPPGLAANRVTAHGQSRNHLHEVEVEPDADAADGGPPGQQREKENNGNAYGRGRKG